MTGMKEHGKLTERQFAGIIANTLIGAGTLILPRTVTAEAGTGAWISILIGGFLSVIALFVIIRLGLRFPEETLMEYGGRISNKWIGGFIG
ncbi:MAG: GerAB/ArcD/ProY family transporter, partial [bacterium]